MKYLKLFENYNDEVSRAQDQLAELDSLRDFALLTADEYKQQSSALMKVVTAHNRKLIKQANLLHQPYSDEWYAELSQHPSLSWLTKIKDMPEYAELISAGLHPVASQIQLGNRTFVFAKDPNYSAGSDYAIGFFSSINVVRRLTPDVIRGGRRTPTLDQKVKSFDGSLEPLDFFQQGMRWVLDNLDLTERSFPNNKTVSAEAARDTERVTILNSIKAALTDAGMDVDDQSFGIIPIDGIRGNMGDIRQLARTIKKNVAKGGPLEVPISQWTRYTQEVVDAMSRYPNIVWTIGPSQIVIEASNTRNWNLKPTDSRLSTVYIAKPLAADDLLRKFEAAGVTSIARLTYPMDQIDLSDYPGIEVILKKMTDRY